MTDRLKGLTVTFDRNIRDDDAELIINAVLMIKGVQDVHPLVVNPDGWVVANKARMDMRDRIMQALKEE